MRIGVSCLQVDPDYVGGVNTYTLGLLEGFAALGTRCDFRLFVTEANQHLFERFRWHDRFELIAFGNRMISAMRSICRASLLSGSANWYKSVSNSVYTNIRETIEAKVDVLYVPTVVLPFFNARKPTVLSIHDIQHVHYPEFFPWPRRLSRRITYELSADCATYLQASSHFIKEDLIQNFRSVEGNQIEVIPEGVNLQDFAAAANMPLLVERYKLPDRYLLYPAQLWPHKNHMTVLKALRQIEAQQGLKVPLVLTGAAFGSAPEVLSFIAENKMDYVSYLAKVPFTDLVGLYQGAAFVIAAGIYESNSLPILEAAAAGTPIIAARIPPNEEVARNLKLNLFDPLDVGDLARLILNLWGNRNAGSIQVAHNSAHIARYSWQNSAQKYIQLFERIVRS